MRRLCWIRRHITLKSNTYTEGTDVDVAGISVKETAHYPGRSVYLSRCVGTTVIER